ncbi:MAG: phage holin family protein [Actinobacteria bacterium]|nr:phage holin family protein [Actinomycetota bacterium]MCL5883159.1 phage holin family protein [Actinomycetota bacterium]
MMLGSATALAIVSLALVVPAWLPALIVTGVWALITAAMLLIARQRARQAMPPVPEKTAQTLKKDARWVRKPTGSNSK